MADILIIDDDQLICDILVKMMKNIGHESRFSLTGLEGLEMARNGMFDLVFLDVNLPDVNGLDVIQDIKHTQSSPEVIIITGETAPDGAEMAIKSGAWNYLEKPFLRQELNLQVSRALQFRKEKGQISTPGILKRNGIVGESDEIKLCLEQVSIAAHSDTNVLISGSKGTGKELFAKTIHLNSDRNQKSFVIADCSSMNESVGESILFGHEKGAFPGALDSKTGLVQQADQGTLFLDEISRLPLKIQQSLLMVMEDLVFRPLGAADIKTSNFRVIATTSKDLKALSRQGEFFPELLERLSENTIELPPLVSMKEDSIKIALFYVDQFCKKYGMPNKGVSPEFIDIIGAYKWPGNVKEMIEAIEKAVASAKNEPTLYSIHLPSYVKDKVIKNILRQKLKEETTQTRIPSTGGFPPLEVFMETSERQYLSTILSHAGGDVKQACRISGISASRMYSRLRKYGLT